MSLSLILSVAFAVIVGIQISYYLLFIFKFCSNQPKQNSKTKFGLSVIICAKNEASNLKVNLPEIINQEYPNFEIILANDSSSDETLQVMESFARSHDNVTVVDVKSNETFWGNKKYALTLAIKAAQFNCLVFTDADCRPKSRKWLYHMSARFSSSKDIVLGYGAYAKRKGSFLNKLIRYETLLTAKQYISFANLGIPYMGVGRNLAYKKELFFKNNGFSNHMKIRSGDDDLFINEVANSSNTSVCLEKEAFTVSEPKDTWRSWFLQKRRHISTAKYYKIIHRLLLGLFFLSQVLFLILAVLTLLVTPFWPWIISLIVMRYLTQIVSVYRASKKLDESDVALLAPILELFLVSFQLSIFIANLTSKPRHWK